MGKNLIQQKRGKGSPTYRSPSFRFLGDVKYTRMPEGGSKAVGTVMDVLHSSGHTAPVAKVVFGSEEALLIASHGLKTGDVVEHGEGASVRGGNILKLKDIPDGTAVFNIESNPGDGGKFVRASGGFAKVMSRTGNTVQVMLPSQKLRDFHPHCRASVGIAAGSGRTEKPFLKAGNKFFKMRTRNRVYPVVSALAMNAVDHPFGGSRTSKKGKVTIARRNAPPGAKVGLIRPRRTGRR
ncbi:50S ribosomal protein L2 [Candidatus Woesearchaeota archaeon]|nr:50S ribosomal protein L2 [Candidatus Woesearchaeota archaeon]